MVPEPTDPIEEIRAIRHELAARFDHDLDRIFADLQRQQQESGRTYITLPKRPPRQLPTANAPIHASGGVVPASNASTPRV